ncbi:hypothetical protein [Acetobacter aceti]|uniref:hypothetical protein n=1 Tax=Acetobacter aceti TaxID=435 RepID=UPI001E463A1E|nr:hypothetical protein [Acetobacter aceti]
MGPRTIAGHALASEIGDVPGERRGPEPLTLLAHDTRLDHDATGIASQPHGQGRASAAPETGTATASPALRAEPGAGMTGLLRGTHDLANEGFRSCALIAMLDASGPDVQTVIARRHDPLSASMRA